MRIAATTPARQGGPPPPAGASQADPEREAFRRDGRRLIGALIEFLDSDAADAGTRDRLEAEACAIVDDQASRLADGGGSLTEAVSGFVAARGPFLAELAGLGRRRSLDPARLADLYGDASALLDRLLLRFIDDPPAGRALIDARSTSCLPALTAVLALVFSARPVRPVA